MKSYPFLPQTVRVMIFALAGWTLASPLFAQTTVTISAVTYPAGQTRTITATSTIETVENAAVVIPATANLTFSAGVVVRLKPGFHAVAGSRFRAAVDSDGDGMPDAWEVSYGLNPNNPADGAAHSDGDAISNLDEFRLGTNPLQAAATDSTNSTQLKVHKPQQ